MRVVLIIVFFSILFIFTSRKKMDGFSRRLLYLYLGYWFLALFFAVIQISGLYYTSNYSLILLSINVLSFFVGFHAISINDKRAISIKQFEVLVEKLMQSPIFRYLLLGCTVLVLYLFSIYFQRIMFYQSIYEVRDEYFENDLYGAWFTYLDSFLLWPLAMLTIPVLGYSIIYKRNFYTFVIALYLLVYESLSGARGGYFAIILGLIFVLYCLFNTIKRNNPKTIAILSSFIFIILFIVFLTTAGRQGTIGTSRDVVKEGVESTIYQVGVYTAAPVVAFDHSIKNHYSERIGGLKYGKLTLSSVAELYNLFGSRVGLAIPMNDLRNLVSIKQSEFIVVGKEEEITSHYNALYTAALWFYLDFGILGVLFIPFILGLLVRWIIKQTYSYFSIPMLAVCFVAFYYMINSVKDFYLRFGYVLLMLIVLYIIGKKTKIRAKV